jgi:hypothetical protein
MKSSNREFRPPSRETSRRRITALITLSYVLLIFEGALRKWVFPSHSQLLFFIRDPIVLLVYFLALRHSLFLRSKLLNAGVAFGVVGLIWVALQSVGVASDIDKWPILAVYGWRNYFFYIPLTFVVAETFERRDIERLMKLTFLLAIPIALLVLIQFRSSPEAPINVGFAANIEEQFHGLTVDVEHTRPMGTFTSDVGQKEFAVSSLAMVLALWILPASRRWLTSWKLIVTTCAVLTCLAVSGSRGAILNAGVVVAAGVISAGMLRKSGVSARAIVLPTLIAVVAILAYPIAFPDGYSVFINRWNTAAAVETQYFAWGVVGRALYGFIDFISMIGSTPLMGFGIGLAGNARLTLGITIPGFTGWAETDWARQIVDIGPLLGVAFIMYRVALVAWLGATCIRGARDRCDPLPFLLFAFVALDVLYGQITGHGTVNGYAWLFAGLALAAARPRMSAVQASDPANVIVDSAPLYPNLLR